MLELIAGWLLGMGIVVACLLAYHKGYCDALDWADEMRKGRSKP